MIEIDVNGITRVTTLRTVLGRLAPVIGSNLDELRSKSQMQSVVSARHAAMWAIRKTTNASLPEIGRAFGQHHTTAMNGIERAESRLDEGIKAELLRAARGEE